MTDNKEMVNPQVKRTRELMLDAAGSLLSEGGPEAVTHMRIAEESGVARATVYRHWPNRAEILLDLLRRGAFTVFEPLPQSGSLIERVTGLLDLFATALNGESGVILSAMIGLAEWDRDVLEALEKMTDIGPRILREIFAQGVIEGELLQGTDTDLLADRLVGPLYFRRIRSRSTISSEYVERLVSDTLLPHTAT